MLLCFCGLPVPSPTGRRMIDWRRPASSGLSQQEAAFVGQGVSRPDFTGRFWRPAASGGMLRSRRTDAVPLGLVRSALVSEIIWKQVSEASCWRTSDIQARQKGVQVVSRPESVGKWRLAERSVGQRSGMAGRTSEHAFRLDLHHRHELIRQQVKSVFRRRCCAR